MILIINSLFHLYSFSLLHHKEFKVFADLLDKDFNQFGLFKKICWLDSRSYALMLSETDYKLIVYDQESKGYGSDELSKEVFGDVDFLNKPQFLFFYLHFLQDLVNILKSLLLSF